MIDEDEHEIKMLDLFLQYSNQVDMIFNCLTQHHIIERKSQPRFLDIGAGNGVLTKRIADYCEVDPVVLEPNTRFQDDLKNLGFIHIIGSTLEEYHTNTKFDLILCSHVMYYTDKRKECINKMRTMLETHGQLVVVLQSNHGEMWDFFKRYASKQFFIDNDSLLLHTARKKFEIQVTIACDSFEHFTNIAYFLLLERRDTKDQEQIESYLKEKFRQNQKYKMIQHQDIYII